MKKLVSLTKVITATVALLVVVSVAGNLYLHGGLSKPEETQIAVIDKEAEAELAKAAAEEATTATFDIATFVADAAKGKKVSNKCKACHKFKEGKKSAAAPNLWGVFGRDIASTDFKYSKAFIEKRGEITWNDAELSAFLTKPKQYIPKTKMVFPGLKKEEDRLNLIAWLKTLK